MALWTSRAHRFLILTLPRAFPLFVFNLRQSSALSLRVHFNPNSSFELALSHSMRPNVDSEEATCNTYTSRGFDPSATTSEVAAYRKTTVYIHCRRGHRAYQQQDPNTVLGSISFLEVRPTLTPASGLPNFMNSGESQAGTLSACFLDAVLCCCGNRKK